MDKFYEYESEFKITSKNAENLINQLPRLQLQQKRGVISKVENMFLEMDELLERMNDMYSVGEHSIIVEGKLKRMGQDLKRLKRTLNIKSQDTITSEREDLSEKTQSQRERLLEGMDKVDQSGDRLQSAYKLGIENEEIASTALGSLYQQHTTLSDDKMKVGEINDQMVLAENSVRRMALHVFTGSLLI